MIDRRALLAAVPALGLLGGARGQSVVEPRFASDPFTLGVASGDPAPDGFVIWTRLAPEPLVPGGGMPARPVRVRWEVAADDGFRAIVRHGEAVARPELAHSVHIEVEDLPTGRPYWYRFLAGGQRSATGRALTAPPPEVTPANVRIGVIGCQHYEQGRFHAHRWLARDLPDLIFHYGDYIYEGAAKATMPDRRSGRIVPVVRSHPAGECFTLDDYRHRYALYKLDPDLQAAHAAAPWICTWDDHEVANNWTGDTGKRPPGGDFLTRRAMAAQAMYEHLPLRRAAMPGPAMRLFRDIRWGRLLDLKALDTRLYRSPLGCADKMAAPCADVFSATRSMIGSAQEAWLTAGLRSSQARWVALAQQVMMASLDRGEGDGQVWNMDSWAGYATARDRILAAAAERGRQLVVLTGDEHRNYALEVRQEARRDAREPDAVEFVATSASSGGDGVEQRKDGPRLFARNPGLRFLNDERGYLLCEVDQAAWRTAYRVVDSVRDESRACTTRARYALEPDFRLSRG